MFEFEKLCEAYENLKNGERKLMLQEAAAKIISAFQARGSNGMDMFLYFVATACGSDGHMSPEEYSLFQEVSPVQLKYTEAQDLVKKFGNKEGKQTAQILSEMIGMFDEEMQHTILSFCLCFCSADKKVSLHERKFLKGLVK